MDACKKFLSLLLCAAMLLSMFALTPAAQAASGTDGSAGSKIEVPDDLPESAIYLCNAEGKAYRDASGSVVCFGSLHEAIDAAQTRLIVVQHMTGTTEEVNLTNGYYLTDRNREKYYNGTGEWPSSLHTYTGMENAIDAAQSNGYELVVREGAQEDSIYLCDIWGNVDTSVKYETLDEAFAAADALTCRTVVLSGTVQYDRPVGADGRFSCTCTNNTRVIKVTEDLSIIAQPGGEATVVWDQATDSQRSIRIMNGASLTVGSDGAGTLTFDGGAVWSGDFARWDEVGSAGYEGSKRSQPLFYLECTENNPDGGYLTIGSSVTVRNYAGASVISTSTATSTDALDMDPEDVPIIIEFNGTVENCAAEKGGAIYLSGGQLYLGKDALLTGNSAEVGGAICVNVVEGSSSASMHSSVVMDGAVLEHNSAFAGGAVAMWSDSISLTMGEYLRPSCTFTMVSGEIRDNTAHAWYSDTSDLSGGGGAVLLDARDAVFHLQGGSITGNVTLPLESTGDYVFEQAGHAIMASGTAMGDQQVIISGGTIKENGDGTGTAIDIRSSQFDLKIVLLFAAAVMLGSLDDLQDVPFSSRLIDRLVEHGGINDTSDPDTIDFLSNLPLEDFYQFFFDAVDYLSVDGFTDSELSTIERVSEMYEAGIGDSEQALTVSGNPELGTDQNINLGVDAYMGFENPTPGFVPVVNVGEFAVVGSPVVAYGEGFNFDAMAYDKQFTFADDDVYVIWDPQTTTWYVAEPEATYSVTFVVGQTSWTESDVTTVLLPTAADVGMTGTAAENFYWYYEKYGFQIPCQPGEYFHLGEDMTFFGTMKDVEVVITVDLNGGTINGLTQVTNTFDLLTWVSADTVELLYGKLDDAKLGDDDNIIPAGLTTEQVDGYVDADGKIRDWETGEVIGALDLDCEVYHTLSAVTKTYDVNPYFVEGEATLYILWAVDDENISIPDFLEVTLTLVPNGGYDIGESSPEGRIVLPKGTEIPESFVQMMMGELTHPGEGGTSVLIAGVQCIPDSQYKDGMVTDKIFGISDEDKAELADLAGIALLTEVSESFVLNEDVTFYAVWSYDTDGKENPDVFDADLTLYTNGGLISGVALSKHTMRYPIGASVPFSSVSGQLSYPSEKYPILLAGFTESNAVAGKVYDINTKDQLQDIEILYTWNSTESYTVTGNAEFYAVWSYHTNEYLDSADTPDILECAVTLDLNCKDWKGMDPIPLPVGSVVPADELYNFMVGLADDDQVTPEGMMLVEVRAVNAAGTETTVTGNFCLTGDVTFRAIWCEAATLTIDPNGGLFGESSGPVEQDYPIGRVITQTEMEYLAGQLTHEKVDGVPVVLIGYTVGVDTDEKIYTVYEKDALKALNKSLIRVDQLPATFEVTEDVIFYAVWGTDSDGNDIADACEYVLITLDPQGGSISQKGADLVVGMLGDGDGAIIDSKFVFAVKPTNESNGKNAVWMTYSYMQYFCQELLIPPVEGAEWDIAADKAGNKPIADMVEGEGDAAGFYIYDDFTIYAIWGSVVTLTLDPNGGYVGDDANADAPVKHAYPAEVGAAGINVADLVKFKHPDSKVKLIGITTNPAVEDVVYDLEDRADFLEIKKDVIFTANIPSAYELTENVTFYAVWGLDRNNSGDADVCEPILTFYANGGTIDIEAAKEIGVTGIITEKSFIQATVEGHERTPEELIMLIGMIITPPQGKVLAGIARDSAGDDMVTENIVFTEDVTLYAIWRNPVVHHNNGTDTIVPVANLLDSSGTALDPEKVASLLGPARVPEDVYGRKIVAAGLTTQPVNGIVDAERNIVDPNTGNVIGTFSGEVYHTVRADVGGLLEQAVINPYTVEGNTDLYILWAYDVPHGDSRVPNDEIEKNDIPDFLEVIVQIRINGKWDDGRNTRGILLFPDNSYAGGYRPYGTWCFIVTTAGSQISHELFEMLMEGLYEYEGELNDFQFTGLRYSVLPVGLGLAESYEDDSYRKEPYSGSDEHRLELATLKNVRIKENLTQSDSFTVTEDTRFYVIWGYNENEGQCEEEIADVIENATLVIDPNGGTVFKLGESIDSVIPPWHVDEETGLYVRMWDTLTTTFDVSTVRTPVNYDDYVDEYGELHDLELLGLSKIVPDRIFAGSDKDKNAYTVLTTNKSAGFISIWGLYDWAEYEITGYQKYYAVWGYNADNSDIPDVLEVTLTLDPNGGQVTIDGEPLKEAVSTPWVDGTELSKDLLELVMASSEHEKGYLLIGFVPMASEGSTRPLAVYTKDHKDDFAGISSKIIYANKVESGYVLNEDTTFYAIWGENTNDNKIADVLEAELTIDPNGGMFGESTETDSILYPVGSEIPKSDIQGLLAGLSYPQNKDVVLVGITSDKNAVGQVYSGTDDDKLAFRALKGVIRCDALPESYTVVGDVRFYAIWGKDENGNGKADVLEDNTVSVTITWGSLVFNYEAGVWDPGNLTYGEASFTPTENSNLIVIYNKSEEVSVTATVTYQPNNGYANIVGRFSEDPEDEERLESIVSTVYAGESLKVKLWLEGTLTDPKEGDHTCGWCIVEIQRVE